MEIEEGKGLEKKQGEEGGDRVKNCGQSSNGSLLCSDGDWQWFRGRDMKELTGYGII